MTVDTTQFRLTTPAKVTKGAPFTFTVTALNSRGGIDTDFVGGVGFKSSDPRAILPWSYSFTPADQGVHTFNATLRTSRSQTITAVSGGMIFDESDPINVLGDYQVALVAKPWETSAGAPFPFTVAILDDSGRLVTGFDGTVRFTSTDSNAALPGDYTFTLADQGQHTFTATLQTPGSQTLTAVSIWAEEASLQVSSAAADVNVKGTAETRIAPVQPATAVALPAISRSNTNPAGTTVSTLLAGAMSADGSLPAGIAVIGATGSGVWQYSANNGAAWTNFGSLSAASARLLDQSYLVRFVPKATFNGVATLSYRAWELTTGIVGATENLSNPTAVGDTTAYSSTVRNGAVAVGTAHLTRLGFATQPPATAKLNKVMPVVRVQLLDQYGQPFKKANQLVTITLAIGKTKVVYQAYTNVNGVAVFRAIVPARRGPAKLVAQSAGLLSAISNPFQVV